MEEPNNIRCPHCAFEIDPRHLQRPGLGTSWWFIGWWVDLRLKVPPEAGGDGSPKMMFFGYWV